MNDTASALERFLAKEDDLTARTPDHDLAALLAARVAIKQTQINTALQALQLAVNARGVKGAEPSPVSTSVLDRANAVLLAAMEDDFYQTSHE